MLTFYKTNIEIAYYMGKKWHPVGYREIDLKIHDLINIT